MLTGNPDGLSLHLLWKKITIQPPYPVSFPDGKLRIIVYFNTFDGFLLCSGIMYYSPYSGLFSGVFFPDQITQIRGGFIRLF
jgi:hypothetical protein